MQVVIVGASGFVGSALVQEALERGHQVSAVVRDPGKLPKHARLRAVPADVTQEGVARGLFLGHDAVLSAFSAGVAGPDAYQRQVAGSQAILEGVKSAGVPRLLVVGGAGSLKLPSGEQLVDSAGFPELWKPNALATREVLRLLQAEPTLDWTFLSPAAHLEPGPRSAKFRLGGDSLLTDAEGHSRISVADYALALLDELEQPRHSRQRFSVAY
jgi:putative NADH-flavin reductase